MSRHRKSSARGWPKPVELRDGDLLPLDLPPGRSCRACGAPLERRGRHGPVPQYCGEPCRAAAYRRRERGLPENLPRQAREGRRPRAPIQHAAPTVGSRRVLAAMGFAGVGSISAEGRCRLNDRAPSKLGRCGDG